MRIKDKHFDKDTLFFTSDTHFFHDNIIKYCNSGYSDTTHLETGILQCSVLDGNKKVFEFESMQEMVAWATS